MSYISEKEFNIRLKRIQAENKSRERKELLKVEKAKYRRTPKIETSKLIAIYLFVLFNVVLIYSMVAMWVLRDLSYLGVLITDIAAQILLFAIYCLKAYKGKKQEEYMKFEREKLLSMSDCMDSDEDESVG